MDYIAANLGYILIAWACVVIAGIYLGWNEVIVVFRDYDDLAIVFGCGVLLTVGIFIYYNWGDDLSFSALAYFAGSVSIALFIYLVTRTMIDNNSIWKGAIAIVTKLTLSILFLGCLLDLLSPTGKTQIERSKNRGAAVVWLTVLTPIVYRLVRNKTGNFLPDNVFNKYNHKN